MTLEARAETLKLGRLLHADADRLAFLADVPAGDVAALREQVTDLLFDADAHRLERLAEASRHLPVGLTATIGQRVFGPLLCARIAGLLDPDRAVAMARHLEPPFLAEVAAEMDPRRASGVIGRMDLETSVAVAGHMAAAGEHVAMGRFVGHLDAEALQACAAALSDADLLRIGYVMEGPERLDEIVATLADERIDGIARAAAEQDLVDEALSLLGHLGEAQRARMVAAIEGRLDELDGARRQRVVAAIPELEGT